MIRRIEINTTAEKKRKKMESKSDAKARRQYEFVDVNQVHDSLVKFFTKTYGVSEKCKGHVIRIYLFIVALLGSDFSTGEMQQTKSHPINHTPCSYNCELSLSSSIHAMNRDLS